MFATYLRRELGHRTRQTVIVALGMALAIGLVVLVSAISSGVRAAQAGVLQSVYGVGTDITVSQTAAAGEAGGPRFQFEADAGTTDEDTGSRTLSQSTLSLSPGTASFDAGTLDVVESLDGVAAATATLSLRNTSFSGEMPDFGRLQDARENGEPPSAGGADGAGGSAFDIASVTVEGVDVDGTAVGPLTAVALADGRGLLAEDAGTNVAVLDASYAASAELAVGDAIDLGGEAFEVVGVIASTSAEATTAANAYIPLDVAQSLAGLEGQVSTVYVQATDSTAIAALRTALEEALPDATVSTQADLAASVSGSLSTAADLVGGLGTWLSVIVLAAAFLIAILFTLSGVARRTREFGTLKAIGWSNGRIVRQVAGESLVQGALGGLAGIAIGLAGVAVVDLIAPTLSAGTAERSPGGAGDAMTAPGGGAAGGFAGGGPFGGPASTTTEVVLNAPVEWWVIVLAVGLAIVGGLLAGAIGGWRAARLRPAEALRSVA